MFKWGDPVWYKEKKAVAINNEDQVNSIITISIEENVDSHYLEIVNIYELTPRLREAQECWVRCYNKDKWIKKHYLKTNNDGNIVTTDYSVWLQIRLTDPNTDKKNELTDSAKEIVDRLVDVMKDANKILNEMKETIKGE